MAEGTDTDGGGPHPEIDADNRRFWDAVDDGRLLVWTCDDCGRSFLPPLPGCPHCGSLRHGPAETTGRGRLQSWIVVHRAMSDAFVDEVPYVVGAVMLDEGARIFGRLVGRPDDLDLRDGLDVRFAPTRRGDHRMIAFEPGAATT